MNQIFAQLFYEMEKHRDTVLVTLIENVEDITEYLENGASDASVSAIDMFLQFLECNTNESHFRVGISKRTHL